MLKVNGKAYDWGDVDLKIPGLNIQVQEISYDDELEMEEVYGSGSKPRGYGTGNYKASGKLSMLRDDYDDLLAYRRSRNHPADCHLQHPWQHHRQPNAEHRPHQQDPGLRHRRARRPDRLVL